MSRDPYESLRHALTIIPLIQQHQGITVDELARRTGLSRRVLADEVSRLVMMCGVPPYAPNNYVSFWVERGRVFIRFAEQFERPVRLVLQEAVALVLALKPLTIRQHPFREAAAALREKILAVVGPEGPAVLETAERAFRVAGRDPGGRIAQIREAMARCQQLAITYWSAHRAATSERVIRPYGLVEHRGDWYVVAHDSQRDKPISFRVDRIRAAELLDDEYEVPLDFDVGKWRRDQDFVPSPRDTVAEVLFSGRAARFAREQFARKDLTELPDDQVVAKVRVASEVWFLSWLLPFGPEAEVIGPAELRENVRGCLERIVAAYA